MASSSKRDAYYLASNLRKNSEECNVTGSQRLYLAAPSMMESTVKAPESEPASYSGLFSAFTMGLMDMQSRLVPWAPSAEKAANQKGPCEQKHSSVHQDTPETRCMNQSFSHSNLDSKE